MAAAVISAAMVFAAGRGERMRPLSDVAPKPALPLPDGPLVASALAQARGLGAERAAVNTWHLAARMEAALAALDTAGLVVRSSREPVLMGTAGGLALARERGLLGDDGPVLVANGDCHSRLDLVPLLERHLASEDLVTLALLPHPDPWRWSRIRLAADGRVLEIAPRGCPASGETPHLYSGVMLVARSALAGLAVTPGGVAERLWPVAARGGALGGVVVGGQWREVGEPAAYLEAALAQLGGRSRVDDPALVAPSAQVQASWVTAGARVGEGATVVESVVAAGARVGRRARVTRSVLLGAVAVAPGEVVAGVVRAASIGPHG